MCDYSLQGLANRLAIEGEQLITHRFPTQSMGMASPVEIEAAHRPKPEGGKRGWWSAIKRWLDPEMELNEIPAVCIPPGARLRMKQVPNEMQNEYALQSMEEVTFVQLTAAAYRYRDAVRFANGRCLLLQAIREGVPFEVLSLGSNEAEDNQEPARPRTLRQPDEDANLVGRRL
jgi:hypothetical protein